ncbi:UNVERIFIED_CONTAM: hypothetical protein BEN50_04975 [Euhalothece sp. KZN 001]
MKVKGIKRGKIIELLQETSVADGTPVFVEIPESHLEPTEERKQSESSFTEATKEFIGCLNSDLEDLSHNPQYLEGFGE